MLRVAHGVCLTDGGRLVDAGCGLYLRHVPGLRVMHDDRVRPYRPLPLFHPDTIVQHYVRPDLLLMMLLLLLLLCRAFARDEG